jgi:hypothetical protein
MISAYFVMNAGYLDHPIMMDKRAWEWEEAQNRLTL